MSDPTPTAIIVEDEPQIRRFVRIALEGEGWLVFDAATLRQGLVEAGTRRPDLIVLDLGMPDGDGVGYLHDLRAWSQVPVIVLSARADEADKIAALDAGADDYVTKPFAVGELLARVRAALRRAARGDDKGGVLRFGDVQIDLARRTATALGEPLHFTPIEYRLLAALAKHHGAVATQRRLLVEVWGPQHAEDVHYLRVYMKQLREKIERDPTQPAYLLTEIGIGYRLVAGTGDPELA